MRPARVLTVVGARPQFVKAAMVGRAFAALAAGGAGEVVEEIVHTGQHYDHLLSGCFFEDLGIPDPVANLGVGSGLHGATTGAMLAGLEREMLARRPDLVLVYGDTNSTLAGALAAAKLGIPIAHVEAGLRSFDPMMPEEINRALTDRVSSLLFCPTPTAVENLEREGLRDGVHRVGDVMYDAVLRFAAVADRESAVLRRLGLAPKTFYLATVHRAKNADDPRRLAAILDGLRRLPRPAVLPLHPRTRKALGARLPAGDPRLIAIEPVPYLDMLALEKAARIVLTDAGGVQKEACWRGTPCITLREETEWEELVRIGWNRVAGVEPDAVRGAVEAFEAAPPPPLPDLSGLFGDGRSAERIAEIIAGRR